MTTYSRFATLISGVERGVDLSTNTLNVGALQIGSTLLSQAGAYATYNATPTGGTAVVITAVNPGAAGNSILITLTGSNSISSAIGTWNTANPTNTAALTGGDGTQVLGAQTLPLTGGVSAGSTLIGDTATYAFFTPTAATIAGALMGINNALGTISGSAITSLTGDATATGPGAAALTLATVNGNVGSFGSSTSIPSFTVNAKGLITAASGNAVVAPAGTLSGTTLNSTVVSSSLTSVGTITSGTWTGTTIAVAHGGTGQTTANAAFDALSPMTTAGDLVYEDATPTAVRLGIGTTGQVLTVVSGLPAWATASTGSVSSVSVVTANGFAGTVATATSTPAITIETTLTTPVLAGNGTALIAATTTGTGSTVVLNASPTFTGTLSAASASLTGALNMNSNQINNVANGTASGDAVNLSQLQAAIAGLSWEGPAQAYADGNVPLTGGATLTIDGYAVQNGDKVILGNQTTAAQNGEYVASGIGSAYVLTANGLPTAAGDAWLILNGTVYADSAFVANAAVPAATFTEFAGPTAYTFMAPLLLTGRTVSITQATTSTNGYLSSTDWNTFNNKQAAGNYITALTGDATASGPGSAALTLATVNSNVGSFGSSTAIPNFTVNAKGLITAAGSSAVVAPAGTLTGTTLASNVVTSSLTSVGTITSGTWTGTTIAIANGGTGQTTATAAFDALSPLTTAGDTLYYNGTHNARLPVGSAGQVLTVVSGEPAWATAGSASSAPVVTTTVVAGQTFTANTTYAVRWGMNSNGETTDRVYAADYTTSSKDFFWCVGVISGGAGVSAGGSVTLTSLGTYTLGSADTGFLTADAGQPVWLTASGAFSTTAPSTAGLACTKIGMVQSTGSGTASQMWVSPQVMGVN